MVFLAAAILAPIVGPILYKLLHDRPDARRIVDGSVYVLVPVLVAWDVLPHAWESRSVAIVVAVTVGFLLPSLVERASHRWAEQTDNLAIVVGLSGLLLHALLEGAALADPAGVGTAFGLAVALHRIPVSLVIWWLVRPRFGIVLASAGVGSLILATLAGFGLGTELLMDAHGHGHAHGGGGLDIYQAFVSGSLVHVVFHQGRHDHDHSHDHEHHES